MGVVWRFRCGGRVRQRSRLGSGPGGRGAWSAVLPRPEKTVGRENRAELRIGAIRGAGSRSALISEAE